MSNITALLSNTVNFTRHVHSAVADSMTAQAAKKALAGARKNGMFTHETARNVANLVVAPLADVVTSSPFQPVEETDKGATEDRALTHTESLKLRAQEVACIGGIVQQAVMGVKVAFAVGKDLVSAPLRPPFPANPRAKKAALAVQTVKSILKHPKRSKWMVVAVGISLVALLVLTTYGFTKLRSSAGVDCLILSGLDTVGLMTLAGFAARKVRERMCRANCLNFASVISPMTGSPTSRS